VITDRCYLFAARRHLFYLFSRLSLTLLRPLRFYLRYIIILNFLRCHCGTNSLYVFASKANFHWRSFLSVTPLVYRVHLYPRHLTRKVIHFQTAHCSRSLRELVLVFCRCVTPSRHIASPCCSTRVSPPAPSEGCVRGRPGRPVVPVTRQPVTNPPAPA